MNPFVANYRDVGSTINALSGIPFMREGVILRGGKIEDIPNLEIIGSPRSIVNLRKGRDPELEGVQGIYSPAPDSVEVYDIAQGRNKKWISETLVGIFEKPNTLPCFIHCAAGKDRTGVIVAAILSLCGVDQSLIRDEYLLSAGLLQPKLIGKTILDLQDPKIYRKLDIQSIRKQILND